MGVSVSVCVCACVFEVVGFRRLGLSGVGVGVLLLQGCNPESTTAVLAWKPTP